MFKLFGWALSCLRLLTRDKSDLVLENMALRHQLLLLQRQSKQPKSKPTDRLLWSLLSRLCSKSQASNFCVKLALDSAKLKAPVTARWFDRTSGEFKSVEGSPIANIGTRKFTPRRQNAAGEGDWVQFLN